MARTEDPLHSLAAGTVAGAVEGVATYPTEYVKTQAQLARQAAHPRRPTGSVLAARLGQTRNASMLSAPLRAPPAANGAIMHIVRDTMRTRGVVGFYAGCLPMATGNALKAGVRFLAYDSLRDALRDDGGKLTLPRSVLGECAGARSSRPCRSRTMPPAGFCAGLCEGAFAVTPSEAIKTRMIQDKALVQPRFTGTLHGIATIAREEGVPSLYRGLTATMLRQGANSAVRLSSYSALRSTYETSVGYKPGSAATFAMGAIAGVITVYCTMPFEWVFRGVRHDPLLTRIRPHQRHQDTPAGTTGRGTARGCAGLRSQHCRKGGRPASLGGHWPSPDPAHLQRRHCIHRVRGRDGCASPVRPGSPVVLVYRHPAIIAPNRHCHRCGIPFISIETCSCPLQQVSFARVPRTGPQKGAHE